MSPLDFFGWLADTSWSVDLHESQYAYSIIESVHVWAMAVFFGLAIMFDLRLLGWTFRSVPVSEFNNRVLPWTLGAFAIMVVSGTLLFYAIPLRSYQNIFFRSKMILLVLAGLNAWIFHARVFRAGPRGMWMGSLLRRLGLRVGFRLCCGSASSCREE